MRLGLEIELRRRTPAACFNVIVSALSYGHAVVREIRNRGQNFAQSGFLLGCFFLGLGNLLAQFFRFVDLGRSILAALFELGDLLGSAVAARLQSFRRSDGLPALAVDGA